MKASEARQHVATYYKNEEIRKHNREVMQVRDQLKRIYECIIIRATKGNLDVTIEFEKEIERNIIAEIEMCLVADGYNVFKTSVPTFIVSWDEVKGNQL